MRRSCRRLIPVAASVLALAFPAGALGQTPGDEQYTDPFGGSQPEQPSGDSGGSQGGGDNGSQGGGDNGSQGGGDNGSQGGGDNGSDVVPETPTGPDAPVSGDGTADTTQAPEASPAPAEQQLPYTGAGAGLLALGGTLLLAGGVALRVRLGEHR